MQEGRGGELAGVRFSDFVRNFPRFVFVQQIDALRVFSQKLEANGVERADGHGADRTFAAELLFEAFAHFPGGLVREGYSGDFRRLDAAVLDEIGDARDECLGFSVPGPAITDTARSGAVTAASCSSFRPSRGPEGTVGVDSAGADSAFAARFWSFLAGPFFAGVCPRKKLICPFSASISSGRSSWIFPYAPSYPGGTFNLPGAQAANPLRNTGAGDALDVLRRDFAQDGEFRTELPQHGFVLCGDLAPGGG